MQLACGLLLKFPENVPEDKAQTNVLELDMTSAIKVKQSTPLVAARFGICDSHLEGVSPKAGVFCTLHQEQHSSFLDITAVTAEKRKRSPRSLTFI
jgi:hypothetical protein